MKRFLVLVTLILFMAAFTLSLPAQDEKRVNVFGGLGFAVSDFEGLFIDVGAEMQFTGKLYGQVLFDYYMSPSGVDLPSGVNDSVYGLNLYGVYKHSASEKMNLFVKAGVHYSTYKVTASDGGLTVSLSSSDFGLGGGGGIEYLLNDKMALCFGATVKFLFAEDTLTWFKFYGSFSYRVK